MGWFFPDELGEGTEGELICHDCWISIHIEMDRRDAERDRHMTEEERRVRRQNRIKGKPAVVEYAPDPDLKDVEQVLLLEEGGIEGFLRREVLPYAPDAWYDPSSVKVGYEISFTRYFYRPQPLRAPEEIWADIRALKQESEGLLGEIMDGN